MAIELESEWAAAKAAIAAHDYEGATLHLLKVVEEDEENAEACAWLGACYGKLHEYVEAEYYLSQACELAPDKPQPHYNLGRCFEARHQMEMAIRSYENSLRAERHYKPAEEALQRLHATLSPDLREEDEEEAAPETDEAGHGHGHGHGHGQHARGR